MKGYLLDTHAALFWWGNSAKLGEAAREVIGESGAPIMFSAASAWEIATKFRLGKLDDIGDPVVRLPALINRHGFTPLAVSFGHGLHAGSLVGEHRDPFDRLIAAQGMMEDLTIITRDPQIATFGCRVIW